MSYLECYMSSRTPPLDIPCNKGIEAVPKLLEKLTKLGILCRIIDTCDMSEEKRGEIYNNVIAISVRDYFQRREIFRDKRGKSNFFGKEVPALVIYEAEDKLQVIDVLPKMTGDLIITIKDFLEKLVKEVSTVC